MRARIRTCTQDGEGEREDQVREEGIGNSQEAFNGRSEEAFKNNMSSCVDVKIARGGQSEAQRVAFCANLHVDIVEEDSENMSTDDLGASEDESEVEKGPLLQVPTHVISYAPEGRNVCLCLCQVS